MYNFKEIELKVESSWKKHSKEIKKSLQYNPKKPLYSFLEGPPTANAPPGLHHVEARTFKDLFCRFKYMQGYSVPRKGGWDCHGLPVEVQIERELKLNSKKEILAYGIDKFVKKCRESVFSYINDWNELTKKMAYWIDLEDPYITLTNEYMESVWWSLKELYNKNLLYEDHKVVPYCPRCQTPLSSHEVALGYDDITEPTVTVKVKLTDKPQYLLIWTTTPWTLPANLAIAVHPNLDYVTVQDKNLQYIIAKDLAEKYFQSPKILKTQKGKDLAGLTYQPIFPYFKDLKNSFKIILANFVTTKEGTGLVHMAPAFGEDDYEIGKKNNIGFVQPVNNNGYFTNEVPDFAGLFVKEADPKIIKYLEDNNLLFKEEHYTHTYPFCWRCSTPLLYYAMKSWFIRTTAIKKRMIDLNKKINWYPLHIKEGRFGDWLENLKDWALSRSKFWGTPLPIWRCIKCNKEIIISSIKELKEKSITKIKDLDLHKPKIDEIELKCPSCSFNMKRVPDVIDTWYDSGSASFAQLHYPFENKELFKKFHPYSFIAEAIDQTRGWFYTLHAISTLLFNDLAYKNVVCAGHTVDEKGEKMSKSKGNILNPWEIFSSVGVDATRLQFCSTFVGDEKRFSINLVNQRITPFLTILWNSYLYTRFLNVKPDNKNLEIEDKWLISRTNTLIKGITQELEQHNYNQCLADFIQFTNDDLSRWYIQIIRARASNKDPRVSYTLQYALTNLVKLLAPFSPYITDYIYQDLTKESSVHLSNWLKPEQKMINQKLESEMSKIREITQEILSQRDKAQLGIRWPLPTAIIHTPKDYAEAIKNLNIIIKKQVNVKEVIIKPSDKLLVEIDTKLTPELEKEGFTREVIRRIQDLRKKSGLKKEDKIILDLKSETDIDLPTIKKLTGTKEIKELKKARYSEEFKVRNKEFEIKLKMVRDY